MPSQEFCTTRAITGCVAAFAIAFVLFGWTEATPTVAATASGSFAAQDASCPLTSAQQKASIAAWQKLMPVFRHPRCINCHGAMPSPLPARIRVGNVYKDGPPVQHA